MKFYTKTLVNCVCLFTLLFGLTAVGCRQNTSSFSVKEVRKAPLQQLDSSVQPAPNQAVITALSVKGSFFDKAIQITPSGACKRITSVLLNGKAGIKKDYKVAVFKDTDYYLDIDKGALHIQDIDKLKTLEFQENGKTLGSFTYDAKNKKFIAALSNTTNSMLRVKLTGSFESAIVNQKKYDGISGASGSISTHKNSNVRVMVSTTTNPTQSDWVLVKNAEFSFEKSKVLITEQGKIEPQEMGMAGLFLKDSSSLVLAGKPNRAGKFLISVDLRDNYGRTARSNELEFNVYDPQAENATLENFLKNAKNEQWDMEPWAITQFGNNNTVRIPSALKRWFGSHTSGTYGELGYPVGNDESPVQTLIVEHETKLINMKILSSVNIVVKNGGKLNLQDSSVYGTITIEKGGTIQANYNTFKNAYETGTSINGQLILQDGARIDSSLIYSNTNFLANGTAVRRNDKPVVHAEGDVDIIGKVYIRGDLAATGNSSTSGKPATGQPAMEIKNGSVRIADGAELGLYGGGDYDATTTTGGAALILQNGTVTGGGRLIAIGGASHGDDGADAVTGTGSISSACYLQGGNTYRNGKQAGKSVSSNVSVKAQNAVKKDGKVLNLLGDNDQPYYWRNILKEPPVPQF